MTSRSSLRTRWAAIGAAVAVTLGAAGIGGMNLVSAQADVSVRSVYVAAEPCRLIDTRSNTDVGDKNTPFGPDETLTITAHGSNGQCIDTRAIPTDAVGLALNVTAVGATVQTFLTVWAGGTDPGTSNLNPTPGQPPTPNAVNAPLSSIGTFDVRNNLGNVDVIIDVLGYYVPEQNLARLAPVIAAQQVVAECRNDGSDVSGLFETCGNGSGAQYFESDRPFSVMLSASFGWASPGNETSRGECRIERNGEAVEGSQVSMGEATNTTDGDHLDNASISAVYVNVSGGTVGEASTFQIACREIEGDIDWYDMQLVASAFPSNSFG